MMMLTRVERLPSNTGHCIIITTRSDQNHTEPADYVIGTQCRLISRKGGRAKNTKNHKFTFQLAPYRIKQVSLVYISKEEER